MKRLLSLLIVISLLVIPVQASAVSAEPDIEASAAILLDMKTGDILYEKDAYSKYYPASTTKMMTCLLALENLDPAEIVTADDEVASTGGSSMKLAVGEEMDALTMITGMMVMSANDAAVALGKAVAGSTDEFAKMMNARAKEIGTQSTNFVNPNGLHDDEHVSTAYDLSLIARECMKNETFREIVKTGHYTVPATNKSGIRNLSNTNLLLYDEDDNNRVYVNGVLRYCKYDGCIGIKTGYTGKAGGCLVSAVERGDTTLLCVVMNSSSSGRFSDSIALFDWGFENYRTLNVMTSGTSLGTVKVKKGAVNRVEALMSADASATIPVEASDALVTTEINLSKDLQAPLEAGDVVGEVVLRENEDVIASYSAIAAESVARGGILSTFGIPDSVASIIFKVLFLLVLLAVLFLIALILYLRRAAKIRKKKLAARRAAKAAAEAEKRREWERNYRNRYRDYPEDYDDQYRN